MTGKEAIRHVSSLVTTDVRALFRSTKDATLKLVCKWRLTEREAFNELAVYASGYPPNVEEMFTNDRLVEVFREWQDPNVIAEQFKRSRRKLLQLLTYGVRKQGHTLERRGSLTSGDREYRVIPKGE